MANRYYTLMVIPERSSRVKKWIVTRRVVRGLFAVALFMTLVTAVTSFLALRYIARFGDFEQAQLKNRYLEGRLQALQSEIRSSESTLVRIQNFEQKLRVLARLDAPQSSTGIGPLSPEEERRMLDSESDDGIDGTQVAYAGKLPQDTLFKVRSMELSLEDLHSRAMLQEQSLQEVYELLKDQASLLSSTPSIRPAEGWLTSHFGYRVSPFTGLSQMHEGLDIAAPVGTDVIATADGIVTKAGTEPGFGKVLVVNHGYGVITRYAHNSNLLVKVGEKVKRGQKIALVGNTGRSTGPHVHYEVRVNGVPVNPARYILN